MTLTLLAAGCAGGQQDVFTIDLGFRSAFPSQPLEPEDIGLFVAWLQRSYR